MNQDDTIVKVFSLDLTSDVNKIEIGAMKRLGITLEYTFIENMQSFQPLYLISNWKVSETYAQWLTVAIMLTFGVKHLFTLMSVNGNVLELTAKAVSYVGQPQKNEPKDFYKTSTSA